MLWLKATIPTVKLEYCYNFALMWTILSGFKIEIKLSLSFSYSLHNCVTSSVPQKATQQSNVTQAAVIVKRCEHRTPIGL